MTYHKKKLFIHLCLIFIVLAGAVPVVSFAKEKKLVVNRDGVEVHLGPESGSKVISVLQAGTELMLESDRKFRKNWYYVYFPSEKSAAMRSGYIHENDITRLYTKTTVATLNEKGSGDLSGPLHFRKTSWGMSKTQVMVSEGRGGRFTDNDGLSVLHYKENLLSQSCELNYIFSQGRLTGAKYRFSALLENRDRLKTNFSQILGFISGQYGPPVHKESEPGSLNQISLFPNGHGNLHAEELLHKAFWETPETEIMLLFYKSGKELILDVEYLGVEYKEIFRPKKVQTLTEPLT